MTSPAMQAALDTLQRVFGYPSFRGQQAAIIETVIEGNDAVVLMPTGGGKSICYQIPALVREGTGLVISPLIALMRDQVDALQQAGVRAAFWNSALSDEESRQVERTLREGALDLLYVSPERMSLPYFQDMLQQTELSVIAVDEAHCVSQWGHDFRPEYRALHVLDEKFPDVPRMALTATADPNTRQDLIAQLRLENAAVFISSFDRPNIRYTVQQRTQTRKQLLDFLEPLRGQSGIVYCGTRNKTERTAEWLQEAGFRALSYHGGMSTERRDLHQDRFLKEDGLIMCATLAFGMGIDKPDVRFVAHTDMPKSIEAYYQETGRAGRDGLPAQAWMIYGMGNVMFQRQLIDQSQTPEEQKRIEHTKLNAFLGYCEAATCRRNNLLRYLGEQAHTPCGNCDVCLNPPELYDPTVAQKALAAVYRTGQRFGTRYLIDVLRGRATDRIVENGHDRIKTFGVGKDLSVTQWRSVYRQLLIGDWIISDPERHRAIRLAEHAGDALTGKHLLELRKEARASDRVASTGARRRTTSHSARPQDEHPAMGSRLFEALRALRLDLARSQGVPPYVIFNDRTLLAMCEQLPRTEEEFLQVPGVGKQKLQRYGEIFLQLLREH